MDYRHRHRRRHRAGRFGPLLRHRERRRSSNPAHVAAEIWTRVAYPEGWRNDTTINEYVPIVNPNPFPVDYRLVAHYETGERDQVIAEGTIPAFTRGGVTISEHVNPDGAIVRLNAGYALELQSGAFLGSTLSHYDSFSGEGGLGAATGEAFTSQFSRRGISRTSTPGDAAFLVFFNPLDQAAELSITLYHPDGSFFTIARQLNPLRRGGLSLSDLGLDPDTHYAVVVSAASTFLAALSSYSTTDGSGFTALGQSAAFGPAGFTAVEFRDSVQNRPYDFQPQHRVDTNGDPPSLLHRRRRTGGAFIRAKGPRTPRHRSPNTPPRGGGRRLGPRLGVRIQSFVESVDSERGDSVAATPATAAFDTWAFADGFLDRNTAGPSASRRSPSTTLARRRPTSRSASSSPTARSPIGMSSSTPAARSGSNSTRKTSSSITPQLTFYSIMVSADSPIVASMIHWDLFQQGRLGDTGNPDRNTRAGMTPTGFGPR